MKKLLLVAVLIWVNSTVAFAANLTGTFGDQNSSKAYRMQVDDGGTITLASDTSLLYPYSTASTNQTLTATQSGSTVIFNNGAGTANGNVQFTLPTAAVGMQYTVTGDIAKTFRIKPQAGDIIDFSTATAGQRIENSTAAAGDSITLFCATLTKWSVTNHIGTWIVSAAQN